VGQPFNEIYCAAKFAVEGYTEAMACYVQPSFGIKFTVVETGGIKTEFANSARSQLAGTGGMLEDEYLPIMQQYMGQSQKRTEDADAPSVHQTPEEVAEVILGVVESDDPPVRIRTSEWAEELCRMKTSADPDGKLFRVKVARDFLGIG